MNKIFKLFTNIKHNNYEKKIKNKIKKLHTIDKRLIPEYLDSLKKNMKIKETNESNEFLKYM